MIKTVNLTKVFRTDEVETTALNNINIEIKKVLECLLIPFLDKMGWLDYHFIHPFLMANFEYHNKIIAAPSMTPAIIAEIVPIISMESTTTKL